MDTQERKKRLEERIEKAEQRAKNSREELKKLKQRMKSLNAQNSGLTKKQQDSIKIWHGIACLSLKENWPELNNKVTDFLEKNVKSIRQRKLMGLSVPEEKAHSPIHAQRKEAPVEAHERIDLVVPYPDPPEARQEVKALGARWDGRVWYVEKGFDLRLVEKYLPKSIDLRSYALC